MAQISTEAFLQRRWIVLTFSFALVALATSSYLFYREFYRPKKGNRILEKYGYLFQEDTDHKRLDKIIQAQPFEPVGFSKGSKRLSCTLSCTQTSSYSTREPPSDQSHPHDVQSAPYVQSDHSLQSDPSVHSDIFVKKNETTIPVLSDSPEFRRVLSDNLTEDLTTLNSEEEESYLNDNLKKSPHVYHGCCSSYPELYSFKSLPYAYEESKILRIVQFKKRKQLFQRDVCEAVANPCKSSCSCVKQFVVTVALVVDTAGMSGDLDENDDTHDENDVRLELVKYRGWCKCVNT